MDPFVEVAMPDEDPPEWALTAISARIAHRMMWTVGPPLEGSNFDLVDDIPISIRTRTRAYTLAAIEHLHMWADYVAPLKFHEEQRTRIDLRPAYTLSRAAMESAAHALWIFGTNDIRECHRRHISLLRWDLQEHAISKQDDPDAKAAIKAREQELVANTSAHFDADDTRSPGSYLTLFRWVCASDEYTLDIGQVESLWRAASGAAHGKFWVGQELQTERTYAPPGEPPRTVFVPDTSRIIEMLDLASYMTQAAAAKFVMWSGHDPVLESIEGFKWLAENMTFNDDTDPEFIARMRRGESPFSAAQHAGRPQAAP